jgi:hypothetical protein
MRPKREMKDPIHLNVVQKASADVERVQRELIETEQEEYRGWEDDSANESDS